MTTTALRAALPAGEWRDRSACQNIPTRDFFETGGGHFPKHVRKACDACPVIKQCKLAAKAVEVGKPTREIFGWLAGMSPKERGEAWGSGRY